jgi:hypothetical protein
VIRGGSAQGAFARRGFPFSRRSIPFALREFLSLRGLGRLR